MTTSNDTTPADPAAEAIGRAQERASRAGDELDAAIGELDRIEDIGEPGALERAAIGQARALVAIGGFLGALTDLALTALREEVRR